MTRLGSASHYLNQISHVARPIRSTIQIWIWVVIMTRHQYGISALISQTSFDGETSGSVFDRFALAFARLCYEAL